MIVVDASVVIKWFIPESGTAEAGIILNDHMFGREDIFVPELLFYEVVNTLRYKRDIEQDAVSGFIAVLSRLELKRAGTDEQFLNTMFSLATKYDISVYDAAYVALAEVFDCRLVTADAKLARKIGENAKIQLIT
ncbi:MAG: type II toxin-antitoxin system VapC family toxin [bacterium]|nr:type II toxin-antitoxin system VapC family toxin [bacterium]